MREIIVVGFSPAIDGPNGVGGFDWIPADDAEALTSAKILAKTYIDDNTVAGRDPNFNITWTYLQVPDLDGAALTAFLNARLDAFELPGVIE